MSNKMVGFGAAAAGAVLSATVAFAEEGFDQDSAVASDCPETHFQLETGECSFNRDGYKIPATQYAPLIARQKRSVRGLRESISITDPSFNNAVMVHRGCSGAIIERMHESWPEQGVYVSTAGHCADKDEDIVLYGNYLDSDGVEQRFSFSNPIKWIDPDFAVDRMGDSYFISGVTDDKAILHYPFATLPAEIVPGHQLVVDNLTYPEQRLKTVAKGREIDIPLYYDGPAKPGDEIYTLDAPIHKQWPFLLTGAGYALDMYGLSANDSCIVLSVGDYAYNLTESDVAYFVEKGVEEDSIVREFLFSEVIRVRCTFGDAASGGHLFYFDEQKNNQMILGNLSSGIYRRQAHFSYFSPDDLNQASAFFNVAHNNMCMPVEAESLALRDSYSISSDLNGPRLSADGDDVVRILDFNIESADGYDWVHVSVESDAGKDYREGYVAMDFLGDIRLCVE